MEAKWSNKEKDPYNFEAETSKNNNLKSKMMFSSSSLHAKRGQPNRKAAYGKSLCCQKFVEFFKELHSGMFSN